MTKPENFILTTDYATLKNDAIGQMVLSITSGVTIASLSSYTYETFLDIGQINAGVRGYIGTTKFADLYAVFNGSFDVRILTRYNTTGNPTTELYLTTILERISPTRLRLYCQVGNPFAFSITVMDSQTVTFELATFLSPFQ